LAGHAGKNIRRDLGRACFAQTLRDGLDSVRGSADNIGTTEYRVLIAKRDIDKVFDDKGVGGDLLHGVTFKGKG
jgi:hypothetical protein